VTFFKSVTDFFLARMTAQWEKVGGWKILLGVNTGGGVVTLRPISLQCAEVWISNGLRCMCLRMWLYVYSNPKVRQIHLVPKLTGRWARGEIHVLGFRSSPCWLHVFVKVGASVSENSFAWIFRADRFLIIYFQTVFENIVICLSDTLKRF
jgi:hypothetical protein